MNQDLTIRGARLVLGDEVVTGSVAIAGGRIVAVDSGASSVPGAADLDGDLLLPGLVELHTDNFERHLMPRPKVRWPQMPALLAHDAEVAAAGITTVFDALGVGDADPEALRGGEWNDVVAAIDAAADRGVLRAEHLLHVRCELPAPNALALFEPFVNHPRVAMISLMDHTPGQRQWENIEQARVYYTGKKGWSDAKFEQQLAGARLLQQRYVRPHRTWFVEYARERGIALASHDDTTPAHVEEARALGAMICEFPTTVAAAQAAREAGMATIAGAPNVVRGGSHSGNVAAAELARLDLLDALSSDYVPASLLCAAFRLVDEAGWSLPRAIASVTRAPARAAGLADRGEIAPGQRADLVQVRLLEGPGTARHPVVVAAWREGRRIV